MARAAFNETIASVAADGTLKAISNVEVTVRKVSDNSLASLWNSRTGSAGGNVVSNPFTTGLTGACTFYADAGEYNISFHDLTAPARIADQTIGWDSVPGSQTSEVTGFQMGDLKISSQSADHGRWLKCNGRELTQAEIESALSLTAGEAASFTTYMGTGSGSKYGTAASSKVKVPDARRKVLLGAGPSADSTPTPMAGTTAKNLGDTAGTETHTLTGDESGVRTHTHSAGTFAAGSHTHADGTLSVASHTHADGTLTVAGHTHGMTAATVAAHTHAPGTLDATHTHSVGSFQVPAHSHTAGTLASDGSHSHTMFFNTGADSAYYSIAAAGGGLHVAQSHVHLVSGSTSAASTPDDVTGSTGTVAATSITGTSGSTAPSITGATATANTNTISGTTDSATPDVTGATAAATPDVTGATAAATAAVTGSSGSQDSTSSGGTNAAAAHNNMPPYVAIGYVFIRV